MKELIKIKEKDGKKAVSARDLYDFLKVKNHFTQWFDDNKNQFDEGVDYVAVKVYVKASNGFGGTNKIDYALTIDCAKELSMLSRVPKGKEARKYFIECEKQLINQKHVQLQLPNFNDPVAAARAWADELEQKQKALQEKEEYKQQLSVVVEEAEKLEDENFELERVSRLLERMKGNIQVGVFAKETDSLFKMGPNQMFQFLRENKIVLYKWNGYKSENFPYQKYIDNEWFKIESGTHWDPQKLIDRLHHTIVITPKGRVGLIKFIANKLKEQNNERSN